MWQQIKYYIENFNPFRLGLFFAAMMMTTCLAGQVLPSLEAVTTIRTSVPGNVFTDSENPTFLAVDRIPVSTTIGYKIRDWHGSTVLVGRWNNPAANPLILSGLSRGYYTLEPEDSVIRFSGKIPFAVVADPKYARQLKDSFFALDTALSEQADNMSNSRTPPNVYKVAAELAYRTGVKMVRDRMHWPVISPKRSEYSWGKFGKNAGLLHDRGIQVMPLLITAPGWSKRNQSGRLPDDLLALYEFAQTGAKTFAGTIPAWEYGNEPDNPYSNATTAWDFAAAQKVAYLGIKAGNPNAKVPLASFCLYPMPDYAATVMENGCANYGDVFNFHIYHRLNEYPFIIADIRKFLARYNAERMPIWITENGTNYEGNGRLPTHVSNMMDHDPIQELILAEFVPKAQITLQSLGVEKDFLFILVPFNEKKGTKVWGIMSWNYTPKPAYVALSNLSAQLAAARYIGKFDLGHGIKAFIYQQPNDSQTLVFWSESELDLAGQNNIKADFSNEFIREAALPVSGKVFQLTDMMGKSSEISASNGILRLKSSRFPSFIAGLRGLRPANTVNIINHTEKADHRLDLSVVARVDLKDNLYVESKDYAILKGTSGKITLELWNFSMEPKKGSISLDSAGELTGIPGEITIPPWKTVRFDAIYRPVTPAAPSFVAALKLKGIFNGKQISPFYMPVFCIDAFTANTKAIELAFDRPERWTDKSSGKTEISRDGNDHAVKFHVEFSGGAWNWACPEYTLRVPEENLKAALGICFEIRASQNNNSKDSRLSVVMDDATQIGFRYAIPTTEWQKQMIYFKDAPTGFKPEKIRKILLGINPKTDQADFWIRNMKVIYTR